MQRGIIILAAGGTGGHVFPAQALSELLIREGWEVFFITDQRGSTFAKEFPHQVQTLILNVKNPSNGKKAQLLRSLCSMVKSIFVILRFNLRKKATLIVGFGGYPALASMIAAQILRIPSVIHEQNAVLGRVNRIFKNQAKLLIFGMRPKTIEACKAKTLVLGNPIRESVMKIAPFDYSSLPANSFQILVIGGSQGANFVSMAACEAIINLPEELRKKITVFHQCRKSALDEISNKYRAHNVKSEIECFFSDISYYLNRASLIISRSGASSLAEFCLFGRPSILIPLPSAVGDHQALNASVMVESGASIVLNQKELKSDRLSNKIKYILENTSVANKMAESAKKLAFKNAALEFVNELKNLENKMEK